MVKTASEGHSATKPNDSQGFYLPSLDVLRLFAFSAVFLLHTLPGTIGDPQNQSPLEVVYGRVHASLGYGVSVFFALSAYLITTLLLREKDQRGRVSLRRFYFRRILRIWPVFFVALSLGSLVVPALHGGKPNWFWFGLFATFFGNEFVNWPRPFPNIGAAPLWSVCVEEQFYIFWPWVVKFADPNRLRVFSWAILILTPIARALIAQSGAMTDGNLWFLTSTHLDCFAAGALVALYKDVPFSRWLKRNAPWILLAGVALLMLQSVYAPMAGFVTVPIGPLQSASYALVAWGSGLIVWTVSLLGAPDPAGLAKVLTTGGKLSYSLYAFHGCAVELAHAWMPGYSVQAFAFEAVTSLCLASASYYGFERRFLRLKDRFQIVKSGSQ